MKSNVTQSRKQLEKQLCATLELSPTQAAALLEKMIDFFKDMRQELRKHDAN